MKTNVVYILIAFFIGYQVGNHDGDQATIRDCATAHQAMMAGGGAISCSVVQTNK
jgi:hypothetical protein